MLAVVNIDVEFAFESVVNEDAGLHANLVILRVPVRLVRDGHTVPSVVVHVTESLADASDDSLGEHVRLHKQQSA